MKSVETFQANLVSSTFLFFKIRAVCHILEPMGSISQSRTFAPGRIGILLNTTESGSFRGRAQLERIRVLSLEKYLSHAAKRGQIVR